jgi:hypothetical protein
MLVISVFCTPVLCGLAVREGHGLRLFENRCCGKCFDLPRKKKKKAEENYIMRNLVIYSLHAVL